MALQTEFNEAVLSDEARETLALLRVLDWKDGSHSMTMDAEGLTPELIKRSEELITGLLVKGQVDGVFNFDLEKDSASFDHESAIKMGLTPSRVSDDNVVVYEIKA